MHRVTLTQKLFRNTRQIHPQLASLTLPELDAHKRACARALHGGPSEAAPLQLVHQLDATRGAKFLEKGAVLEARQAFLEQIRVNDALALETSDINTRRTIERVSQTCWEAIYTVEHDNKAFFALPQEIEDAEAHFALVYHGVFRHTMLHWARLLHIWRVIRSIGMEKVHLRQRCHDAAAPFVLTECGVAGGGCSVLMAVASKLYLRKAWGTANKPPRVIAVDNFIGMPMENEHHDKRVGDGASPLQCGWGEGTCGSIGRTVSIDGLAAKFGVTDLIQCVKGNFDKVLPGVFSDGSSVNSGHISHPGSPRVLFAHIDADWYDSTAVCLKHVYSNVVPGGIGGVQVDDFHYWDGCKAAVHAYFDANGPKPVFQSIEYDSNAMYMPKA